MGRFLNADAFKYLGADGQLPEKEQKVDFGLENDDPSMGASLACLISVTIEASISLRGVFEDFVAYGNRYWW